MPNSPRFQSSAAYQDDVLALPVIDLDSTSSWYCEHFEMSEVERIEEPIPTVILVRDGTQIGFAVNGGDPTQDGAAIQVSNIHQLELDFNSKGVNVSASRVDERDGVKHNVFFVVAPDGLCYYFYEPTQA